MMMTCIKRPDDSILRGPYGTYLVFHLESVCAHTITEKAELILSFRSIIQYSTLMESATKKKGRVRTRTRAQVGTEARPRVAPQHAPFHEPPPEPPTLSRARPRLLLPPSHEGLLKRGEAW